MKEQIFHAIELSVAFFLLVVERSSTFPTCVVFTSVCMCNNVPCPLRVLVNIYPWDRSGRDFPPIAAHPIRCDAMVVEREWEGKLHTSVCLSLLGSDLVKSTRLYSAAIELGCEEKSHSCACTCWLSSLVRWLINVCILPSQCHSEERKLYCCPHPASFSYYVPTPRSVCGKTY